MLRSAVRRWAGPVAGLLAGAAPALTPAAVLMFRFDNPDACWCSCSSAVRTQRCAPSTPPRRGPRSWLVAAAGAVGLGFLTKMGQALLVVPRPRWAARSSTT